MKHETPVTSFLKELLHFTARKKKLQEGNVLTIICLFMWGYGAFTLPDTNTDTNTETDELQLATVLNGIVVSVQHEYLHTILYNPFFIGVCVGQCEHSIEVGTSYASWDR